MCTDKSRTADGRNAARRSCALLAAVCLSLALAGPAFGQTLHTHDSAAAPTGKAPQIVATQEEKRAPAVSAVSSLPTPRDPLEIARAARAVYVRSKTIHVPAATLENELRKQPDFQLLGLLITRDPSAADLWIEVDRNLFTRTFVLTAFDPKSNTLVVSARKKAYLILGDRVAAKLAKSFLRQMRETRAGTHR
jgi:hypothetical protein